MYGAGVGGMSGAGGFGYNAGGDPVGLRVPPSAAAIGGSGGGVGAPFGNLFRREEATSTSRFREMALMREQLRNAEFRSSSTVGSCKLKLVQCFTHELERCLVSNS